MRVRRPALIRCRRVRKSDHLLSPMSTTVTAIQPHLPESSFDKLISSWPDRPSCPTPEQQFQTGLRRTYNMRQSGPSTPSLYASTPSLSAPTPTRPLRSTPSLGARRSLEEALGTSSALPSSSATLQLAPRQRSPSTPVSNTASLSPSLSTPRLSKRIRTGSSSVKTREEFKLLIRLLEWLSARLPSMDTIRWDDFPWPTIQKSSTPDDINLRSVSAYILSQHHDGTISRLDRLKEQLLIWQSRSSILDKTISSDREKVEKGVEKVVQHLSFLLYQQVSMPVHVRTSDDAIEFTIPSICMKFAEITSDRTKYQAFLKLRKNDAQRILDSLHMVCQV